MMSFVAGDLVRLKSGGPLMTVEQVGKTSFDEDGVWCTWFEKIGNRQVVQRETFPPVVLEKSSKPTVSMLAVRR
jgi:uncharacterized protein YodC (DUF2158 family)